MKFMNNCNIYEILASPSSEMLRKVYSKGHTKVPNAIYENYEFYEIS